MLTIERIRAARERIAGRVHVTPTMSAARLGRDAGVALFLKCESLQKTGSFKPRGVLNRLAQLDAAARARGVVTVSAGNHAQALGWAATMAGVQATVVMPATAPRTKVEASREYGAEVVLHGSSSIEAFEKANALAAERSLVFVHPFEDEEVMAGAGTVGLELAEQVADLDAVVVPIGGGGLIGGVATALRAVAPGVKIYGVEPTGAASMRRSLDEGKPVRLDAVHTIADGLAPPMAGALAFEVVRRLVDDVILVTDDEIADAMRRIMRYAKLVAEGGGAAATAAVLSGRLPLRTGNRVAAILSGGNVDESRLREILRAQ
ncbi:MAG TPA: threonine/serine dehydratase [Gemmatimonadaceae bacterium]|nr:threonine/serine dehydratase [Gemmatimonadaceae bacterium]